MKSVYGRAEDFPDKVENIHDPYALAHQIGFFLYELYTTEKSHWNKLLKGAGNINDPEQVAFFTGQETSSSIIRPGAVEKERLERGTIAVMLRNKLQGELADFRLDPSLEEPVLHPPEETASHSPEEAAPRSFGTTVPHSPGAATPRSLGTVAPHSPEEAAPHSFGTVAPHSPGAATPRSLGTATPHSPEEAAPRSFGTTAPHSPGAATPRSFGTATPHSPGAATPRSAGRAIPYSPVGKGASAEPVSLRKAVWPAVYTPDVPREEIPFHKVMAPLLSSHESMADALARQISTTQKNHALDVGDRLLRGVRYLMEDLLVKQAQASSPRGGNSPWSSPDTHWVNTSNCIR